MNEPDEIDVFDQAVERELIRETNERNARQFMLESLRAYLEQYREVYERAKQASNEIVLRERAKKASQRDS